MNIFKYVKYKKDFYVGFITKGIEVVFELLLPIFMAILIDQGLKPGGEINKAYLMVILIIGATLLGYGTTIYAQHLAAKVGQNYAMNLREAIFHKVQDLPLEDTNHLSSSSLLNRLSIDVSNLQNSLSMTIRTASRAPAMMVGSLIALFILSPKIATILLIGLPVVVVILVVIMAFSMKVFQSFQKENDELIEVVKDNVEGARMIRAFAQVSHEEARFNKRNDILSKIMIKLGRITSLSSPFTMLSLNIILVIMLYLGAGEVFSGAITDGELLQVINYTTQLTLSIISVMNLALLYTKAYSSAKRINEVLSIESSKIISENSFEMDKKPAKIEFKNVSFSYGEGGKVLSDINLIINPGETVGIVGLTGSGKTTLVDLILRFFNVTEGEILINDINIVNYSIESLRENIAYASQKPALLSGSIKENIMMNNNYQEDEIKVALKEASANFVLNRPGGLEGEVLREGMNFSGGQRQRIALSRALVKDVPILILDDVFSALDYLTDYNIRKSLNKRKNKQTQIYISQRLSSVEKADNIFVIDEGKIIAFGRHQKLLETNELYQKLYQTQVAGDNHA